MSDKPKKTTNEKPISLHPLTWEQALKGFLAVKPDPKEEKSKGKKKEPNKES